MNSAQFKSLILPCYGGMLALASRICSGQPDLADDIVQDSLTYLWENRMKLTEIETPASFCMTVVRNRCISAMRKSRMTFSLDEVGEAGAVEASACEQDSVQRALKSLEESRRRVMLMSMRGFSNEEIAEELHVSPANVRQILCRARKQLRSLLD